MALHRPTAGNGARAAERGDRLSQQLRTFAVVSRTASAVTSLRDLQEMAYAVVALVSEGLGIEHVGLFVVDEATRRPVLSAASSADTRDILVERQVVALDQDPVVRATTTGHPQMVRPPTTAATLEASEPSIRFELALPLIVHGRVVGVLDLQSMRVDALHQDDTAALSMLADQLGLAIETLRLTEESHHIAEALRRHASEDAARDWALARGSAEMAFGYSGLDVTALDSRESESLPERPEIIERSDGLRELRAPIVAGDRILGSVAFRQSLVVQPWGDEDLAFVAAICGQIGQALERARLLGEAQAQDEWRRRQSRLTERIWMSATDVEQMLVTTIQALGAEFGATGTVQLGVLPDRPSGSDAASELSAGPKATGRGE